MMDTTDALDQIADAYPLTPLQQGMLFHVISNPDAGHYIAKVTALIEGPLTETAAREAWQQLVARHDALRTGFLWEGLDQPMQVVHREASFDLIWKTGGDWRAHAAALSAHSFDLARAPLMRLCIVEESATRFRLIWSVHHLVSDGWSTSVVLREFLALLEGAELLDAPAFGAHAEWLDGLDHAADGEFWADYFVGYEAAPIPANGNGHGFGSHTRKLDPDLLHDLKAQARAQNVTLGTMLQAGFARALGQLTGSRDVIYGLAASGRSSGIERVEDCVGPFVNTLLMRAHLESSNLLNDLEATSLALRDKEHVPHSVLAQHAKTPAGQNLVDAVLSLRSLPQIDGLGGYRISELSVETPSNFPLLMEIDPEAGHVSVMFDQNVMNGAQISTFADSFEHALRGKALSAPSNPPMSGPPLLEPPRDVLGRILGMAVSVPDRIAVTDESAMLSYGGLAECSNSIAAFLVTQGVKPGDRVALVLPRGVDLVAAILGTLIAGAAYVPIDQSYPEARILAILKDAEPKVILGTGTLGSVDVTRIPPMPEMAPVPVSPDHPAYVIYTSGSSGTPKGVEISRGALAQSQAARDQFYPSTPNAFLLMSPFAFDSSVVGLYWSLCNGANLVISGTGAEQDMRALGRVIRDQKITHTLMLPTLYQAMLEGADLSDLARLQQVIVAGEPCPAPLPAAHAAALPECYLANEYGPTEATVWASVDLNAPRDASAMTIGTAIPGMEIYLLDERGNPVGDGGVGEIVLAGPGLATGYVNRIEETEQAFPTLTLNGMPKRVYRTGDRARLNAQDQLVYLGRGDGQIKIRGHRVELEEVATAITNIQGVREVVVEAVPTRPANMDELIAALNALSQSEAAALLAKAKGGS